MRSECSALRQRSINARNQALAASDQALASNQVSVFKALGGGWQGAPGPAAKNDWNP